MAQDTTTALEILATANTTDRNTFNELTQKKYQSSQITTLNNKLFAAKEVAANLKTEIVGRGGGVKGEGQRNGWL